MVGATLGGGVGRYSGYHGMIIDSLLSVKMVTADGNIVTASEKENADLFWAVRGAGMNFGIVLSATYRVSDLTAPRVTNVDIDFPLSQSRLLMDFLKRYETTMPIALSPTLLIGYNPERKEVRFGFLGKMLSSSCTDCLPGYIHSERAVHRLQEGCRVLPGTSFKCRKSTIQCYGGSLQSVHLRSVLGCAGAGLPQGLERQSLRTGSQDV